MGHYIIDTCSIMHFLAAGEQNALIQLARHRGRELAVCAQVSREIESISRKPKFRTSGAVRRWQNIRNSHVAVLSDDIASDPGLATAMEDLHGADDATTDLVARLMESDNLGEFVSAAHALRLARQGNRVTVIVDDGYGRTLVGLAAALLQEGSELQEGSGVPNGAIFVSDTRHVLAAAEAADPTWLRAGSAEEVLARMSRLEAIPVW